LFTVLLVLGLAGIVVGIVLGDWLGVAAAVLCVTSIASLIGERQSAAACPTSASCTRHRERP
jgi:hypothetical protein